MSDSHANSKSHAGEQPGATIGRYRLLEKIGEGGMGTIWMAEQREPVKRRVALKIIKLGMDTKQVVARFEAERQALALMDHPHIAKVFDAGSTESGRPYFVMEYIKGVPIVDYCDQERLDMKARLALFTKVCHAIQHAHHKGIIHRDIKPTNVLVTMMDGAPIPKVIDFGIAKATSGDLTPKTLFTEHRQMIGTPAYMSPEQAEMSGLDVDTRSDVYSLGVLLYELLTGTTPFDTKSLLAAGRAEMMRVIREDEPHTPSHRVSELGDTGARTAQKRQVDLKRLGAELRGDLDWIVMKCLEKDRTRRYETANGLAADVDRHLHGEPVAAGPPGAGYKLRKFVRRNRGVVVAAGLLACVLVLAAAGTTTGMLRALGEKDLADGEAAKAKRAAESEAKAKTEALESEREAVAAATTAEAAQKKEEAARKRAEAISEFVFTALKSSDAHNAGGGQRVTILAAMDRAIADLESGRFKDDPEVEAQIRTVIARILSNNGRAVEAEPLAVRALAFHRRIHDGDDAWVSAALNDLGDVWEKLGRSAEAEPLLVEALEMNERLFEEDEFLRANILMNLARARVGLGRTAEAEPLLSRALAIVQRLYGADDPLVGLAMNDLGHAQLVLGRAAEAEALFVKALEICKRAYRGDHPRVATAQGNLAQALERLDRHAEAEPLVLQTLEMDRRFYGGDNPAVASDLNDLGTVRLSLGRPAEAEKSFVEALEMLRRIYTGDHPLLAMALDNVGKARAYLGRGDEAEAALSEALEMRRRIHKPGHPDLRLGLRNLARARTAFKRWEAAEPLLVEVLESLRSFPADEPEVLNAKRDLAVVYFWLNRTDKSIPLFEEVLEVQERTLGRQDPATINVIANLGVNYRNANRLSEGIHLLEEAYQALKNQPQTEWIANELLDAYVQAAREGGPPETARVVAFVKERIASDQSKPAEEYRNAADGLAQFSRRLLDKELWSAAEQLARECLTIREKEIPDDWRTFSVKAILGGALLGQKRLADAEPLLLGGYRGMEEREAAIPAEGRPRVTEALERLVKLYEAKGDTAEASRWRATLEAARPSESRPSTR